MRAPPRLHVIMAGRSPRAAILCRGPSSWYHVVAWDTGKDTFEPGAWFKGRLYEDRCDLSPDGELFLYFALKGSRWSSSYAGTWTAISRLPWVYALGLWPQGDTWGGGGHFQADRSVVLQTGSTRTHPDHRALGVEISLGPKRKRCSGPRVEGAQWSGHDHAGCIIFAREGKLFRSYFDGEKEIADFNGMAPAPQEAPEWAQRPLVSRYSERRWQKRAAATRKRRRRGAVPHTL